MDVNFGAANEVPTGDGSKGSGNSPDGLLYLTTLDTDQLKGSALSEAIAHTGTHIADIRDSKQTISLYQLESHAWQVTIFSSIANRDKTMTLPGGTIGWNMAWPDADRGASVAKAIDSYLADWAGLVK